METEKYAPHTIPGTQEQYTRLCTTKSMEDVPYLTICMYISLLRRGGGGNHT